MYQKKVFWRVGVLTGVVLLVVIGKTFFPGRRLHSVPEKPLAEISLTVSNAVALSNSAPLIPPRALPLDNESELLATNDLLRTPIVHWREAMPEKTFAQFRDWAERYAHASPTEKAAMESEGVALARTRREALKDLIHSDPERALQLAVPFGVQHTLPEPVANLLEETVSGRGRLAVIAALAEPGKEDSVVPTWRTATIGDRQFRAFAYGWRLGEPTRENVPLNGIAVDNLMAVSANPLRILDPEAAAEAKAQTREAICSVSGLAANVVNQEIVADVGGQTVFLCRASHATELNNRLIAAEDGGPNPSDDDVEASTWSEGQKKLLLIRVDFSDVTGEPLSDTSASSLISNLNNFYTEMSFGRAGFALEGNGSDVTPTLRMPQPASWYGNNDQYDQLRADARSAAAAAGYVLTNYERDVICMGAVPGWSWAGLGYVGASGAWLRNSFSTGVAAHELGHNWGLNHANYWDTSGQSIFGPGTSVEYGDIYDTMGSASAGNNHFNAREKSYLNWLTASETMTVTTSGTYRIYAHDNPNSTGLRGLKIIKSGTTNYWVEFRQKFTSNKWLMNGAGLRWAQNGNQKVHLLDTTPGSTDGKTDSAIVIGRTYSDRQANIHITPIGKGGTSPESLDVVVNLGSFPANLPPSINVTAGSTNAATGAVLNFSAAASDPNGDSLAYYWDFGDGNFGTNGPTAAKSWSAAGEYVVRCSVSDMKGGVGSDSVIVRIGSPTTYRISGQVASVNGPVQGARVYVSSTRMTYTDSDGTYNLVGLPAGTYTVNGSLENCSFTNIAFANPVSVGPTQTGKNFLAWTGSTLPPFIVVQPQSESATVGESVVFNVTAIGDNPLTYQWRFNGTNLTGATASTLTRSAVQMSSAGNYSVMVSNPGGNVTSSPALLSVASAGSRPMISLIELLPNNVRRLTMTGPPGDQYTVEASTNLVAWTTLATVTNLNGSVIFTDATPVQPQSYYRLRSGN